MSKATGHETTAPDAGYGALRSPLSRAAFEKLAESMWDQIPPELTEGVDALIVEEEPLGHPSLPGVFTLGECVTDSWPSGYGEAGDTRSRLILYYGSFRSLASADEGFDWQEETWETVLHELLHHREAAAGESGLDEFDWAAEQNFLRHAERPFDPEFYKVLPASDDGSVRLDSEIFVEGHWSAGAEKVAFNWRRHDYTVRVPRGETTLFVRVRNLASGRLWVVVPPKLGFWTRLLGRAPSRVETVTRRALPALQV